MKRKLAKAFKEKEYDVWFDEDRLTGGVLWEDYIEEGLKWVAKDPDGRMVLIMTPHSVRRPEGFCLNELAYALDLHLPILPIMLVWTTPPLSIYRYQWLDLTHSKGDSSFIEDFKKILIAIECDTPYASEKDHRLERLLDPLDYSNDIALYQPSFIGREWLFKDIDEWLSDPRASRVFFITGLPGIGKTAIMIKLLQTYENVVGFHLFRRGHSEKTSVRRVICSLAFQLSKQLPDYYDHLQKIDVANELNRCTDYALFDILISGPLGRCEKRKKPCIILLDALDESGDGFSTPFTRLVSQMVQKSPDWIRYVITSRPIESVLLSLNHLSPRFLSAESSENLSDIEEYVKKRLVERFGESAPDGSEIVKRSAGIFLYAKIVFDDLMPQLTSGFDGSMLPAGIGDIYYDFFSERFPDIKAYRNCYRPVLELICAQVEPFTVQQLSDCLEIDEEDIEDFIATCSSYFTIDSTGKVRPFHSSILDWLSSKEKAGRYALNPKHGTDVIAQWLNRLFEQSGWDFFKDDTEGGFLYTWFPTVLEQTDIVHFDSQTILYRYLSQVHDKSILKDLVADRLRFHFIQSVLSYLFRQKDFKDDLILEEVYSRVKKEILAEAKVDGDNPVANVNKLLRPLDLHYSGIKYLHCAAKGRELILPPKKERDYYYFIDIQLPLFYTQSSTEADYSDYIFSAMSYGLLSAFEDGRVSNLYGLLSEIHQLAINSYTDYAGIAIKHLNEVSEIMREEGWDDGMWADRVLNCANSIQAKISHK